MGDDSPTSGTVRTRIVVVGVIYVLMVGLILLSPIKVTFLFEGFLDSVDQTYPASREALEIGANILLFVPAGWLAANLLPQRKRWLVLLGAAVISMGVEMIQAVCLPERVPSPVDVLANTLGAVVGLIVAAITPTQWLRRTGRATETN